MKPMRTSVFRSTVATAAAACVIGAVLVAPPALAEPTPEPSAAPVAAGNLVLIGGAVSPGDAPSEAIMQRIVDLAAEHAEPGATPRIAISTIASEPAPNAEEAADGDTYSNATANGEYYQRWFERLGAEVYAIPIDVNPGEDYPGDPYSADHANDPDVAAAIAASDGLFFGGGDQTNYVRALMDCEAPADAVAEYAYTSCTDTPAMAAIRSVVDSGGVSSGTSAGLAIQQGLDMISGGDPYESWRDGAVAGWYDGSDPETGSRLTYIPAGGFGFFSEGTLDSHFARRDRQPRVVKLALERGHERAFGVEEKTALVVDRATRTGEVIGELGASLLDVSDARTDGTNVAGVRYSYFMAGSTIDFATGEITLAETTSQAAGTGEAPAADPDIWKSAACDSDPYIFGALTLAQQFVASDAMRATGDSCDAASETPRYRTTYNRTAETVWGDRGSFVNLDMSVTGIAGISVSGSIAAGADERATGELIEGSTAVASLVVTNTGATPLTGFRIGDTVVSDAVLAPGEQLVLTQDVTVVLGSQELVLDVTATPVDAEGRNLQVADEVAGVTLNYTGVAAGTEEPSGPGEPGGPGEDPEGQPTPQPGTPTAQPQAHLAHTGAEQPAVAWALMLGLLAAGGALIAGGAWRKRQALRGSGAR